MSFSTVLFTERGRALQAKALAGTTLNFTKLAMGSGSLGGQSQITLTALIEPKVTINISEIKRDMNYATIKGNFSNADISTGFYWREIGVFAQDPDLGEILYCYGNAGTLAEYIPPQSSEIIEKVVGLTVIVGNATTVTAKINETLVYATKADINSLSEQLQDAKANINEISEKTEEVILEINNKANLSVIKNVSIPVANWSGTSAPYSAIVNVEGVTPSNNIFTAIGSGASATQYAAAVDAQLHCVSQGNGTILMKAFDAKPTVNIPLSVLILG